MNCTKECPLTTECNACLSCTYHASSYVTHIDNEPDLNTVCGVCMLTGTEYKCNWKGKTPTFYEQLKGASDET